MKNTAPQIIITQPENERATIREKIAELDAIIDAEGPALRDFQDAHEEMCRKRVEADAAGERRNHLQHIHQCAMDAAKLATQKKSQLLGD